MSEITISSELLQISPEVQDAINSKKPVVALESTIISHGMPFPQNAQTAIEVEETIRKHGAVPATIAVIGGVMKVGLSKDEIELLGREGHNVTKVSRRDLPFVIAEGKHGATTVASTMIIAALAGIKVFATGGIGGVHRGAEHTFDISAEMCIRDRGIIKSTHEELLGEIKRNIQVNLKVNPDNFPELIDCLLSTSAPGSPTVE